MRLSPCTPCLPRDVLWSLSTHPMRGTRMGGRLGFIRGCYKRTSPKQAKSEAPHSKCICNKPHPESWYSVYSLPIAPADGHVHGSHMRTPSTAPCSLVSRAVLSTPNFHSRKTKIYYIYRDFWAVLCSPLILRAGGTIPTIGTVIGSHTSSV